MSEPAFDTLEAARRLKAAGMDSEHAEAIVAVMGQSVNQFVIREHFDAAIAKLGTELHARIDGVEAKLHSGISGMETKLQSLEATLRSEIMRAVLIVVGVLIPATGLMMAVIQFYSTRLGGT